MREHLVNLALKLVGCPYIWGGANPWTGFDCSGFVVWVYQVFGLLPSGDWTAQGLFDHFTVGAEDSPEKALPGDLAVYGMGGKEVTHVMLFVNNELVVGASGGDHRCLTAEDARRRGAQVKVKPKAYRRDYLGRVFVSALGK